MNNNLVKWITSLSNSKKLVCVNHHWLGDPYILCHCNDTVTLINNGTLECKNVKMPMFGVKDLVEVQVNVKQILTELKGEKGDTPIEIIPNHFITLFYLRKLYNLTHKNYLLFYHDGDDKISFFHVVNILNDENYIVCECC